MTACTILSDANSNVSRGKVRAWTLSSSDRVTDTSSGRLAFGYPVPQNTPVWIAADLIGGRVLAQYLDYVIEDGYVWFDEDPLLWATVKRTVWTSGSSIVVADLFYCSLQPETTVPPDSGTYRALTTAIATSCDSPCALSTELVEDIWQGHNGKWRVVTDEHAYVLEETDVPVVAIGDTVRQGSPIGTAWELTRLGPALPDLTHITTPATYHQGVTTGGITWYNANTPLIIDTVSSRTRVRWSLGGTLADVDAFWTESHTRGTASGATSIAQAMDIRDNPTNDPDYTSLPVYVNPLEFICRELFAGNAYLLLVRPSRFGPDATTTALRQSATRLAAGPYTTIFDYEDSVPALTDTSPTP